jgi:hypothetical protein
MSVAPPSGQNRIMIYGPKSDGTYVVEFRTAEGDAMIRHFQEWFNPVDFGACSVKFGIIALI